jgi:predicted esterase
MKWSTAPVIISDTVLKLAKAGKLKDVLQAIEAERHNQAANTGHSSDGQIAVVRVGAYKK